MRPIVHDDVRSLARVLMLCPDDQRQRLARIVMAEAEAADRFRARLGRCHPDWGDGTLASAARKRPHAKQASLLDADYCRAMEIAFGCLAGQGRNRPM